MLTDPKAVQHTRAPYPCYMQQRSRLRPVKMFSLLPKTLAEKRSARAISGLLLMGIAAAAGLFALERQSAEIRQRAWFEAPATITDTRTRVIGQHESHFGGSVLYQVQVLVEYQSHGAKQIRWADLPEAPRGYSEARFEEARIRGAKATVRWQADDPDHLWVDLQ